MPPTNTEPTDCPTTEAYLYVDGQPVKLHAAMEAGLMQAVRAAWGEGPGRYVNVRASTGGVDVLLCVQPVGHPGVLPDESVIGTSSKADLQAARIEALQDALRKGADKPEVQVAKLRLDCGLDCGLCKGSGECMDTSSGATLPCVQCRPDEALPAQRCLRSAACPRAELDQ